MSKEYHYNFNSDSFNIRVSSWYKKNGATPGNTNTIATDLVTNLINSLTGVGGPIHGEITSTQLTNSGVIPTTATNFLSSQPAPGTTKPKAYLNWILLDEQFRFVASGSGAEQVGDDQELKVHVKNDMPVSKSGYLYVFVSNETSNIDVYFDNLQVTHIRGAILEETHYYPFGLTMAGISSKALNTVLENKYKFNGGTELNSTFDVNLYETMFRSYDPQLGRFHQIDPMTESASNWSGYSFVQGNPLLFSDPLGLDTLPPVVVNYDVNKHSLAHNPFYWWTHSSEFGDAGSMEKGPGYEAEQRMRAAMAEVENNKVEDPQEEDGQSGGSDYSMSKTAIGTGGLLYGLGEHLIASEKGGYWLGKNGKYYTKMVGRGPNQWTGARSAAFRDSRLFKIAGRATFFVGAFISGYEGVEQFRSGDYIGASKSGLDIGIGAISTYGGPIGLAVGGVYFAIDATIGWDNAMQSQESIIIQNQSIHGSGWSYYGNGGVK